MTPGSLSPTHRFDPPLVPRGRGASARELFALFGFAGTSRAYVKAGKFLPPFGWRLPDDDAFIRQSSGFTYSAPDTGVEIGAEPGRWSLKAMVRRWS